MPNLYLFTTCFPYGTGEEFLEDEILWLSNKFEKIFIVPSIRSNGVLRPLPDNCYVVTISHDNGRLKANFLGLFDFRTVRLLIKDFVKGRVFCSSARFMMWRSTWMTLNQYLHQPRTKKLIKKIQPNDICYSYWGKGWTSFFLLLKNNPICIARFHGFGDLWEEPYNGYLPLRAEYINRLDRAVLISKKGLSYFVNKYPQVKTCVFPLGSNDFGLSPKSVTPGVLQIVSCSQIYPLKRVHLIFKAINNIKCGKIEWTHIGNSRDDKYFNELQDLVKKESSINLKVNFLGYMPHGEVLEYYRSHHFDVFVNLSTLEGVPVSIMEAESFGIPVVATNVGCTCDVMSDETGILVSQDPSVEEVTSAILRISKNRYNPRAFWEQNYNAQTNYSRFSKMLRDLASEHK